MVRVLRGEGGFTLVEAVAAVAVVALAVAPIMAGLDAALAASWHARNLAIATELAQQEIELTRYQARTTQGFETLAVGPGPVEDIARPEGVFQRAVTVESVSVGGVDLKQLAVTVSWNLHRSQSQVRLTTLLARR